MYVRTSRKFSYAITVWYFNGIIIFRASYYVSDTLKVYCTISLKVGPAIKLGKGNIEKINKRRLGFVRNWILELGNWKLEIGGSKKQLLISYIPKRIFAGWSSCWLNDYSAGGSQPSVAVSFLCQFWYAVAVVNYQNPIFYICLRRLIFPSLTYL